MVPKVTSAAFTAVFWPTIAPTSAVPSEVGQFIATPDAVEMMVATSRIPPNAFSLSITMLAISDGTV